MEKLKLHSKDLTADLVEDPQERYRRVALNQELNSLKTEFETLASK